MRYHNTALAALLSIGLAACGEVLTAPEAGTGVVQAAAIGDRSNGGVQSSRSPAQTLLLRNAQGEVDGTVRFRATVEVQSQTGAWVELAQQATGQVQVETSSQGEARVFAQQRADAASYTRARVTFTEVEADVRGGLEIGLGGLLSGLISVRLGSDGKVVVEQPVELKVEAGTMATLLVDLNAGTWLQRADAEARAVSETEFQSAVRLEARS